MNKVLLAGSTGFVGRELIRQLLNSNYEVIAIGRTKPEVDVEFVKLDLRDNEVLDKKLAGRKFDYLMHLASLPVDTGNACEMINVNVKGLQNFLEFARNSKPRKVVVASSISAYGWYPATKFNSPDYMPVDESHPCRPKDMYSATKRMQELMLITYYKQYSVPAVALRLTAVVGPHGRGGGRGWREFAEQLTEGKQVQIPHFSAEELCHYVDIRDVGRMFIAAAEHPRAIGEIFNCCGPEPTRGIEFANIVRSIVPGIKIEYGFPWSMAQGGEVSFDMSKAEKIINFKPKYSMTDSIISIKEWVDAGGLEKDQNKGRRKETFGSSIIKGKNK